MPLKLYLQQKLKLTRRTRSYRSCIQRQINLAEIGSPHQAIRAGILRAVENVEHFRSELNFCSFCNWEGFGKPRIKLPDPGTAQEIARNIAKSCGADTTRGKRVFHPRGAKSRGVESPAAHIEGLAGNKVRTLIDGISVRARTACREVSRGNQYAR